jgi:hypothetical protein
VEGGEESSGGAGSDDEVVLGDEDMPESPTAPVDLSAAAAAAAGECKWLGCFRFLVSYKMFSSRSQCRGIGHHRFSVFRLFSSSFLGGGCSSSVGM